MKYTFIAKLWEYNGEGAWHFITVPVEYTEEIKLLTSGVKTGFGSVKVEAVIGKSTWATSIFPDFNNTGAYLLPVKKSIRSDEKIQDGDSVSVAITLIGV